MEEEVNFTVGKNVNLIVVFILLEDLVTSLIDFTLNVEDELLIGFKAKIAEIVNVEQLELLPAPILILILDQVLLHGVLNFRENSYDFVESLFGDMTDITVVFGLDIGCSSVLI